MTGSTLVLALFEFAFAFFGYRMSVRHGIQRGVTPWRFPSIAWGLICFAIGPLGILVELFAGVTTRTDAQGGVAIAPREAAPPLYGELPPIATSAPLQAPLGEVPVAPAFAPPHGPDGTTVAAFGWYPDVAHRHEYRYFDGKYWSDQVADGGVVGHDPL